MSTLVHKKWHASRGKDIAAVNNSEIPLVRKTMIRLLEAPARGPTRASGSNERPGLCHLSAPFGSVSLLFRDSKHGMKRSRRILTSPNVESGRFNHPRS